MFRQLFSFYSLRSASGPLPSDLLLLARVPVLAGQGLAAGEGRACASLRPGEGLPGRDGDQGDPGGGQLGGGDGPGGPGPEDPFHAQSGRSQAGAHALDPVRTSGEHEYIFGNVEIGQNPGMNIGLHLFLGYENRQTKV